MRLLALASFLAAAALAPADGLAAFVPEAACAHIFAETGVPELTGDTAATIEDGQPPYTPICREGYALLHNNATHIPDWVAEDVTMDEIRGTAKRKDNFAEDPDDAVPAGAKLSDYRGSGFDRGHQAPAGDFKSSQDLMDESFYLSNMAPQVGQCFNRGIWAALEDTVRSWVPTRKRLIVFTGPIYPDPMVTIGDVVTKKPGVEVVVPESFYKIVYHPKTGRALAFVLPNKKLCGEDAADFVTSIDKIEERTGIDFLTGLSHKRQKLVEGNVASMWQW